MREDGHWKGMSEARPEEAARVKWRGIDRGAALSAIDGSDALHHDSSFNIRLAACFFHLPSLRTNMLYLMHTAARHYSHLFPALTRNPHCQMLRPDKLADATLKQP